MNTTYSTRNEAIAREIVAPIQAGGVVTDAEAAYDIEAIADEVLADYDGGYTCTVTADEFWTVVERHAK